MADRMIVVSPDELLGGSLVNPQMISDLLGVAAIDAARIEQLARSLQGEVGFLTEERLSEIVAHHVGNDEQTSAAVSAVQHLRPQLVEQAITAIKTWREARPENANRFSDESLAALREKLPLLVQEYPALSRMRKATRLRGATGNELERIEFICDARPVFDAQREHIEGLLALTTMKLLYERQNGVTEETEIRLNSEQLEDLIAKAKKAQQKIKVLEQSFGRWMQDAGM